VRIRAISIFEGVVYHCWCVDASAPCRPTLEVEAILRPGDADADAGPLLVPIADYATLAGGIDVVRPCLPRLRDRGRIIERQGIDHIAFPTWTAVDDTTPPGAQPPA
jgi:hypothetical protein